MKENTIIKEENIHQGHRNRMKQMFLKHGFDAFTDIEKLEFLLYYAFAQKDTNPIAHKLLDEFGLRAVNIVEKAKKAISLKK